MKRIISGNPVADRGDTTSVQVGQIEGPSQNIEADLIIP